MFKTKTDIDILHFIHNDLDVKAPMIRMLGFAYNLLFRVSLAQIVALFTYHYLNDFLNMISQI